VNTFHAMYLDNLPALASGCEISGYPKVIGMPRLYVDSDTLVGTMDRAACASTGRCRKSACWCLSRTVRC
jgi:acetoacetate decarboxylase